MFIDLSVLSFPIQSITYSIFYSYILLTLFTNSFNDYHTIYLQQTGEDYGNFTIEKKADATYRVVSAASIIAKVTRDRLLKVRESESKREGWRVIGREGGRGGDYITLHYHNVSMCQPSSLTAFLLFFSILLFRIGYGRNPLSHLTRNLGQDTPVTNTVSSGTYVRTLCVCTLMHSFLAVHLSTFLPSYTLISMYVCMYVCR